MSKITDALNMAEGARQTGNTDIAIRILIETLREIEEGRRRITPEETGRVWELWRRGVAVEIIAEKLGYTVARVKRVTRKLKGTWGPK